MSDSADHFDHDAHVKALEDASNHLYRDGEGAGPMRQRAMAGACSRASAIHRQLRGRVAHARQAELRLKRLYDKLNASALVVTGDKPITMSAAASEVWRIMSLLRGYVSQPNAPWIGPSPVMFPIDEEAE